MSAPGGQSIDRADHVPALSRRWQPYASGFSFSRTLSLVIVTEHVFENIPEHVRGFPSRIGPAQWNFQQPYRDVLFSRPAHGVQRGPEQERFNRTADGRERL